MKFSLQEKKELEEKRRGWVPPLKWLTWVLQTGGGGKPISEQRNVKFQL